MDTTIVQKFSNKISVTSSGFLYGRLDLHQTGPKRDPDWITIDEKGAKKLRKVLKKWLAEKNASTTQSVGDDMP